jgi:RHS repeat-associated protein
MYLHGFNDYPLVEKTTSGVERRYIYGVTGLILIEDENNVKRYVQKDHLGSTRALYDAVGSTATVYDYDPYGRCIGLMENTPAQYRFTGQEFEVESGLHNFRARMYDDEGIFFTQTDPANQNYAPYSYCAGNPIMYVDPTGRQSKSDNEWDKVSSDVYYAYRDAQMNSYLDKIETLSDRGCSMSQRYLMSGPSAQSRMSSGGHWDPHYTYAWTGQNDQNMQLQTVLVNYEWVVDHTPFDLAINACDYISTNLIHLGIAGVAAAPFTNFWSLAVSAWSFSAALQADAIGVGLRGIKMMAYNTKENQNEFSANLFRLAYTYGGSKAIEGVVNSIVAETRLIGGPLYRDRITGEFIKNTTGYLIRTAPYTSEYLIGRVYDRYTASSDATKVKINR